MNAQAAYIDSPENRQRLFLGSFLTLVAAGMGFSARGAILGDWGAEFGFTRAELGVITGFGLTGFGLTVVFFSLLVERWGYGVFLALTFVFHTFSAVVTLLAGVMFHSLGKEGAFYCLSAGTMCFAFGNAAAESAINPLIALLHPQERTHRMNMLHAGFPGGLILGAVFGRLFQGQRWEVILLTYLAPTLVYGVLLLGRRFPASQAQRHRLRLGQMIGEFKSPVFLALLVLMAMVGYVELGTDSWISNLTGTIMADPVKGLYLFIWTSCLMFVMRFSAGPIVQRISPLGLLAGSAALGGIGLFLLSQAGAEFNLGGPLVAACLAVTIYGVGKSFYWGTMLGVVAERFPRGGALTLGALGCIGTWSAGLLGTPTIGFIQDHFASQELRRDLPAAYERYRADQPNSLLWVFHTLGLDNAKVAVLKDDGRQLAEDRQLLQRAGKNDPHLDALQRWWDQARPTASQDREPVFSSILYGSRMALRWTALLPVCMLVGFTLLIAYFRSQGGYQQVQLDAAIPGSVEEIAPGQVAPASR